MPESNIKESIDKLITGNDMLHIPSKQMRKLLKDMVDSEGTGSGGSSGGGGNVFEMLNGYMSFDTGTWVQTDEEKALNAQLYTKIVSALENDGLIGLYSRASTQGADIKSLSMSTFYTLYNGIIMLEFMNGDGDYKAQITADGAITANFVE